MEIRTMTDDALVELFAKGKNQAFDVLLERHKDNVYNYILLYVRNDDLADDIFQDVFMKAIISIKQGRYVGDGRLISWLLRIAHNEIIDYFRRERNGKTVSNDENEEIDLFNDIDLCDENIEDKLIREQSLEDVKRLMQHLPDNQREVVIMRYYQDMEFKDIAERTGVSINTALGRMRYAVINMRRMAAENDITLTL